MFSLCRLGLGEIEIWVNLLVLIVFWSGRLFFGILEIRWFDLTLLIWFLQVWCWIVIVFALLCFLCGRLECCGACVW